MAKLNAIARALCWAGCLAVAVRADDGKSTPAAAEVTVFYRGEVYHFAGRDAENLSRAGVRLLASCRTEQAIADSESLRRSLETAQKRSGIVLQFAKPLSLRTAGTDALRVEKLIIPFSPDLDPQTVFVLPGRPARAFTGFRVRICDDLRSMLEHARVYPPAPGSVVQGVVRLAGPPPVPRTWPTDAAIQRKFGLTRYTEETWQVGPKGGLRNCVVTLRDHDPDRRMVPRPLSKASIEKDMVRFEPHVLVVTPGTPVTLGNPEDSPCKGFHLAGSRPQAGNDFNFMIPGDREETIRLRGPDVCRITCPVRPYARGFLHVVDTPYFAVTDADGHFRIRGVPEGDYDVSVWHEAVGRLTRASGPVRLSVADRGECALSYRITPPSADRK